MPRKVCLSGFAKISRNWANEQPDDVEVWGMNEGHAFLKRPPDRWFQIHPPHWNEESLEKVDWPKGNYGRHPAHITWMAKQECPVYMQEPDPRIPTAVKYPLDEILAKYRRYLTSTTAYMMALLLYEHEQYRWWKPWSWKKKVESITIAGIEMAIGTEYMLQRSCVEYYLGKLEGAGIEFIQPPTGTSILHGEMGLYAVDYNKPIFEGDLIPVLAKDLIMDNLPQVKFLEDEGSDGELILVEGNIPQTG